MTVGAGWSVVIAPLQQQLTVATRSKLSQLVGGEAMLAHLPCIGVARGAQLDRLELVWAAQEPPPMRRIPLERSGIATMAVVTLNTPLRVDPHGEGAPLLGVAYETTVGCIGDLLLFGNWPALRRGDIRRHPQKHS
jgi:hypothetical protein